MINAFTGLSPREEEGGQNRGVRWDVQCEGRETDSKWIPPLPSI